MKHGGGAGCAKVRGAVAMAVAAAPANKRDPRIRGDVVLVRMKKKLPDGARIKPTKL